MHTPTHSSSNFMTLEELRSELGISRSAAYELARQNKLPIPTIRVGRQFRLSRVAFNALLCAQGDGVENTTMIPNDGIDGLNKTRKN